MSAFFLLLAVPSLVSGFVPLEWSDDEYSDCQPTGDGGISCSPPDTGNGGRTSNKLGKCDWGVAEDCATDFESKYYDVVEPS